MNFEAEKQFKKDFGITINEAERKLRKRKSASDEIFSLKLYLNGFDIVTGQKVDVMPSKEEVAEIEKRITELYKI